MSVEGRDWLEEQLAIDLAHEDALDAELDLCLRCGFQVCICGTITDPQLLECHPETGNTEES